MTVFDSVSYFILICIIAGFARQHYKYMKTLYSLREFVEKGSAHNTAILNSSIERANTLDIQFQKLSGSINSRVKDLEIKLEAIENPTTKDRIRKKIDKHYKRK